MDDKFAFLHDSIFTVVALYSVFYLWGILGLIGSMIYIFVVLFYIFAREERYATQKGTRKITEMTAEEYANIDEHSKAINEFIHDRKSALVSIYLYTMPLAIIIIMNLYFNSEDRILYIAIFLIYFISRNSALLSNFSFASIIEMRNEKHENNQRNNSIKKFKEEFNDLNNFVNRLSKVSGYDEQKIREIEDIEYAFKLNRESDERIENYIDDEEKSDSKQENYSYTIDENDSKEDIIWKWADAYGIPAEIIPRNLTDLLGITSIDLSPFSVSPYDPTAYIEELTYVRQVSTIDKIPKELFSLENLTELFLTSTLIDNLPREIKNLKNLKKLSIDNTKISQLPEEIAKLKNLEYLNIDDTKIEEIPEELIKLQNLKIYK